MKRTTGISVLFAALAAVLLLAGLFAAAPALAAPPADAGGFPTLTPSPTATATDLPEVVIVTAIPPYPAATDTPIGLDGLDPSSIIGEQPQLQPTTEPEATGGNALITAAYIGLFIFLVVGVWMLFSRRGMPNP